MRFPHLLPLLLFLAACAPAAPDPPATDEAPADAAAPPPRPGSDRDAHGCIGSAGYAWCERTAQCERPWELARREGVENAPAAIDAWCGAPAD
ncbi:peptidase [Luteimonas sp. Y-2-2-4F]|nr:peptidase [Luteimonas sp. Y-2-2-4F]MCD9033813.1 peptidase [Luteimonas sp. Y-2-2-4F]